MTNIPPIFSTSHQWKHILVFDWSYFSANFSSAYIFIWIWTKSSRTSDHEETKYLKNCFSYISIELLYCPHWLINWLILYVNFDNISVIYIATVYIYSICCWFVKTSPIPIFNSHDIECNLQHYTYSRLCFLLINKSCTYLLHHFCWLYILRYSCLQITDGSYISTSEVSVAGQESDRHIMCVRGINYACFYNFLLEIIIVPSVAFLFFILHEQLSIMIEVMVKSYGI